MTHQLTRDELRRKILEESGEYLTSTEWESDTNWTYLFERYYQTDGYARDGEPIPEFLKDLDAALRLVQECRWLSIHKRTRHGSMCKDPGAVKWCAIIDPSGGEKRGEAITASLPLSICLAWLEWKVGIRYELKDDQ